MSCAPLGTNEQQDHSELNRLHNLPEMGRLPLCTSTSLSLDTRRRSCHTAQVSTGADPDLLDRRLLALLHRRPQIGVLGASRTLGVARGTVQARLERLVRRGIITTFAPQLDPAAMGYPVSAFCTLEIDQGAGSEPVVEHLAGIPEVLEVHTITGDGDLLLRMVSRDNTDLQRVIDQVVADPRVRRTSTVISLGTRIGYRVLPLIGEDGEPLAGAAEPRAGSTDGAEASAPAAEDAVRTPGGGR